MIESASLVLLLPVTTASQVADVARMAHEVWNEYYVPFIGQAQVDYMVARFQTADAMQSQIDSGYDYFQIHKSGENIGYAAVRYEAPEGRLFISKFYLLSAHRRTGAGRQTLTFIEQMARDRAA